MTRLTGSAEAMCASLQILNLDCIKYKLVKNGWSRLKADQTEVLYRRFLWLALLYPDAPLVPTEDVDKFWHQHILDTRKYALDCEQLFGYFLHHCPYFGMRDEADKAEMRSAFRLTCELYEKEFGSCEPRWSERANADAAFCGGSCKDMREENPLFEWRPGWN